MRRIFSLAFVLIMVFSLVLAACSPSETTASSDTAAVEGTSAPASETASATEEFPLYAGYDIATLTGTIKCRRFIHRIPTRRSHCPKFHR